LLPSSLISSFRGPKAGLSQQGQRPKTVAATIKQYVTTTSFSSHVRIHHTTRHQHRKGLTMLIINNTKLHAFHTTVSSQSMSSKLVHMFSESPIVQRGTRTVDYRSLAISLGLNNFMAV
jgi:hypothetical protein